VSDVFDYAAKRDTADRLITKFGQAVTFRRSTASGTAFDPTLTPADYATKGAKVDFSKRQLASGEVLATDERWLIAAGPLALVGITDMQPPDRIVIGGVERQVVKAETIAPAGIVVVFDVQARK
jgi:hypothetical protein